MHPDMAQYSLDRQTDALSRRNEARARLATLPPEQVAKVSPFLHPEQLQDRAMASLAASIGQRYEEMEFRGYATAEAIDQNRWNALTQPLPPHASPELFDRVFRRRLFCRTRRISAAMQRTRAKRQTFGTLLPAT